MDFIDGGPPSNTISITNFSIVGSLNSQAATGSVTGLLPGTVVITDGAFFNELLADISFGLPIIGGARISFDFDPTANAPNAGSIPDSFSVFLLDPAAGLSLFTTTDPTGADALFHFDINATSLGLLTVYAVTNAAVATTVTPISQPPAGVPEPGSMMLIVIGLLIMRAKKLSAQFLNRGFLKAFIAVLFALAFHRVAVADVVVVDSRISKTNSGFVFNRTTNTFDVVTTITNVSSENIGSPITLSIDSLSSPIVSLANANGEIGGKPYINVPASSGLLPGATTKVLLKFASPSRSQFQFTTKITGAVDQLEACAVGGWRVSTDAAQNSGRIQFQYVGNTPPIGLPQTSSRETQIVNGMFGLGGASDVDVMRLFCASAGIADYIEDFLRQTSRAVGSNLVTRELGGVITLSDGTSLVVPPGAVKSDVTITVTAHGTASVLNDGGAAVIELSPDGLVFEVPVSLIVPYVLGGTANPDEIAASLYSPLNQPEQIGSGEINIGTPLQPLLIDRSNQRLEFSLNHFSTVLLHFFPATIIAPYLPPRFLQPGDIIFSLTQGRWTPGHTGLVGDLFHIDTTRVPIPNTPVIESYPFLDATALCPLNFPSNPIAWGEGIRPGGTQLSLNFLNDVYLGARRPLFNSLTPASRQRVVDYARSKEGACYLPVGVQPFSSAYFSCVSLVEESYRAGGLSILTTAATLYPALLYNITVPVSDVHIAVGDNALIPIVVISRDLPIPFTRYVQNSSNTSLQLQSGSGFAQLDAASRVLSLSPQTGQACTTQTVSLLGSGPLLTDRFDLRVHVTDFQLGAEEPKMMSTAVSSRPQIKVTADSSCGDKIIKGMLKLDGNVVFTFDNLNSNARSLDLIFTPTSDLSSGTHNVEAVAINENGVRAEFSWSFTVQQSLTVTISPPGAGRVNTPVPAGGCSTTCTFPATGTVSLTAFVPEPTEAYSFSHWSGDCGGTSATTTVTVTTSKSCTANFVRPPNSANVFQITSASTMPGNVIKVEVRAGLNITFGILLGPIITVCEVTDNNACILRLPSASDYLVNLVPRDPLRGPWQFYVVKGACANGAFTCPSIVDISGRGSFSRDAEFSFGWAP